MLLRRLLLNLSNKLCKAINCISSIPFFPRSLTCNSKLMSCHLKEHSCNKPWKRLKLITEAIAVPLLSLSVSLSPSLAKAACVCVCVRVGLCVCVCVSACMWECGCQRILWHYTSLESLNGGLNNVKNAIVVSLIINGLLNFVQTLHASQQTGNSDGYNVAHWTQAQTFRIQ